MKRFYVAINFRFSAGAPFYTGALTANNISAITQDVSQAAEYATETEADGVALSLLGETPGFEFYLRVDHLYKP